MASFNDLIKCTYEEALNAIATHNETIWIKNFSDEVEYYGLDCDDTLKLIKEETLEDEWSEYTFYMIDDRNKCNQCNLPRYDYMLAINDDGTFICSECNYKNSQVLNEEIDLDRALYPKGLDWTFDKPPLGSEYVCVYIIKKKEE